MSAYLDTINKNLFKRAAFIGDLPACEAQGEAAGDQAFPRDSNPYPAGYAEREWWDAGWCRSKDELCGEP